MKSVCGMEKGKIMIIKEALFLFLTATLLFTGRSMAGDWPHWWGPYFNGSSDEKNLPVSWSETENIDSTDLFVSRSPNLIVGHRFNIF